MSPQIDRAYLVGGPSGAGKTSAARTLARMLDKPSAHISLDSVRLWRCNGHAEPMSGWTTSAQQQYKEAQIICASAVKTYAEAGIETVLDDAIFPDGSDRPSLDEWIRALEPLFLSVCILLPREDVLQERNACRPHPLPVEVISEMRERMLGWQGRTGIMVIDNSKVDIAGTARAIWETVAKPNCLQP